MVLYEIEAKNYPIKLRAVFRDCPACGKEMRVLPKIYYVESDETGKLGYSIEWPEEDQLKMSMSDACRRCRREYDEYRDE